MEKESSNCAISKRCSMTDFSILAKKSSKILDKLKLMITKSDPDFWSSFKTFQEKYIKPGQIILMQLLVNDFKIYKSKQLERIYWKILCYDVIKILDCNSCSDVYATKLQKLKSIIVNNNILFYNNLLELTNEIYCFSVKKHTIIISQMHNQQIFLNPSQSQSTLVFWYCIALGDLYRYCSEIMIAESEMYHTKSYNYYSNAYQLLSNNPHSYNQLAILQYKSKDYLGTLYFYVRSFLLSYKESDASLSNLQALFAENRSLFQKLVIRKQVEQNALNNLYQQLIDEVVAKKHFELWVTCNDASLSCITVSAFVSNFITCLHSQSLNLLYHFVTNDTNNNHASRNQSMAKSRKYFLLYFIHLHGKIFTKTDLDSFDSELLKLNYWFNEYLNCLLTTTGDSGNKFTQRFEPINIIAINIFSIHKFQLITESAPHTLLVLEKARQLNMSMAFLMFDTLINYFKENLNGPNCSFEHSYHIVSLLLSALWIWYKWWNIQPTSYENDDKNVLLYEKLVILCTTLKKFDKFIDDCVLFENKNVCQIYDIYLRGCPFLNQLEPFLSGDSCTVLSEDFSVLKLTYKQILNYLTTNNSAMVNTPAEKNKVSMEAPPKPINWFHIFVDKLIQAQSQLTFVLIQPKYLVFDTNCLIEYMPLIEAIYDNKDFNFEILVPLTVMDELTRLAQMSNEDETKQNRLIWAKSAVEFINKCLEPCHISPTTPSPNKLALLTSHGNILHNTTNLTEDTFLLNHNDVQSYNNNNNSSNTSMNNLFPYKSPKQQQKHNRKCSPKHSDNAKNFIKNGNINGNGVAQAISETSFSFRKGLSTYNDDVILKACENLMKLQESRMNLSGLIGENGRMKVDAISSNEIHNDDLTILERDDILALENLLTITATNVVFFTDDQNLKIKAHTMLIPTPSIHNFIQKLNIPFPTAPTNKFSQSPVPKSQPNFMEKL